MKYKNYKAAIHNFTHSFISIDYMKSGRLAVNTLIDLYKIDLEAKVIFDFMNKLIKPKAVDSKNSKELLSDYIDWLPEHFKKQNCDLSKLEKLEITIWIDFDKTTASDQMNNAVAFELNAITKWKADGKDEEILQISQTEVTKKEYLELGFPEIT